MSYAEKYDPNRKWIIEVTEQQLHDIINDMEDIYRFLAGDTELYNTTSYVEPSANRYELRRQLQELQPSVTPELEPGSNYDWCGSHCPNNNQREKIARNYAIYRNLRHCLECFYDDDNSNVYRYDTLTCGVPLAVCYPKTEEDDIR